MTSAEKGRVTCLIRKGINYKRLENHELPTSSLIFIKIKCSQRKSFTVGAYYREWQQPSGVPGPNTRELEDQLERLKHAMEKVVEVSKVEDEIILNGDMNIDIHDDNDPLQNYENRKLYEIYEEHLQEAVLHQCNFEPTHHWPGRGSTLIDHYFCSNPEKVDNMTNHKSMIADHDAVTCNYHVKDVSRKPQTRSTRNYKDLTKEKLQEKVDESDKLDNIF